MKGMSLTDVLAAYGAFLATVLAVWDATRYVLERPRLRVTCYIAEMFAPGVGRVARNLLAYKVANPGGKPIVVTTVGGEYEKGKAFVLVEPSVELPRTLNPHDSVIVTGPLPKDIDRIKSFVVHDALGKAWTASVKGVRKQLAARAESE